MNRASTLSDLNAIYPDITAEYCALQNYADASCQACVESCPKQAWVIEEDALGLDTGACDGCGLCVPACPTGALHIHFPYVIRHISRQAVALFGCERSCAKGTDACMPCVHALGIRQLLLLHVASVSFLLFPETDCPGCSVKPRIKLRERVNQLNDTLEKHHQPTLKLLYRPARMWRQLLKQEALISKGSMLSRRAFLTWAASTQAIQEQLVAVDPLNRSECQTIPPGLLLDESGSEPRLPWVPVMNEDNCTGCDACVHLCPSHALDLVSDKPGELRYEILARHCTGCGICADVCQENALQVREWYPWNQKSVTLIEKSCVRCGNPFHLPQDNSKEEAGLCPTCQISRHSKLFQVMDIA